MTSRIFRTDPLVKKLFYDVPLPSVAPIPFNNSVWFKWVVRGLAASAVVATFTVIPYGRRQVVDEVKHDPRYFPEFAAAKKEGHH